MSDTTFNLKLFHDRVPYYIETSLMICRANQLTGFLYDRILRHEKVNVSVHVGPIEKFYSKDGEADLQNLTNIKKLTKFLHLTPYKFTIHNFPSVRI